MIKFICETPEIHQPFTAVNKVEFTVDHERSLDEMYEAFDDFLKAIGYAPEHREME